MTSNSSELQALMLTIDEIKDLIRAGKVEAAADNIIDKGSVTSCGGQSFDYTIHCGEDLAKCIACDDLWPLFNLELMEFIDEQNFEPQELQDALDGIQIDDAHWNWFKKALYHRDGTYHWFFLMADEKPQCASLIYHPKKSAHEDVDLFYIEYIAVAPWNRENPMKERIFRGLGSLMIKSIVKHLVEKLAFNHAFSLHALPRAVDFYKKIGMKEHPPYNKDGLVYFEMPNGSAKKFMEMK